MKKKLVLIICFLNFILSSTVSSKEKMSTYISNAQMQRPVNLISSPEVGSSKKIQRTLYRTGSVDSDCIKNLYNQFRYKNRSGFRRPIGITKPSHITAFRKDGTNQQILFFYKTRDNLMKERQNSERPWGNGRIIFVPPYIKANQKRVNFFPNANEFKLNKTSQSNQLSSHEDLSNQKSKKVVNEALQEISLEENPKKIEENIKLVGTYVSDGSNRETKKQYATENSKVFVDVHEVSLTTEPSNNKTFKIPQKSSKTKSTTESYFKISFPHFWYEKEPAQTQPYEVEEIIEEELSINLNNEKKNKVIIIPPDSSKLLTKEIKKVKNSENDQKTNNIQDIMGSSINTVIKTLLSPMMKVLPTVENDRKTFPSVKVQNHPNSYFTTTSPTTSPRFVSFPDQRFSHFHKVINSSKPLPSRYEQSKHLKMKNPQINEKFRNRTQQKTESTADPKKITFELNSGNKVNMVPPLKIKYGKNVYTTDHTEILYTPSGAPKSENNTFIVKKNPQQKATAESEIENISLPFSESIDKTSFTRLEIQNILKSFTTQKTLSVKTEDLSTVSSKTRTTLYKILPSQELTTTESTDLLDEYIENSAEPKTSFMVQNVETVELPSEIAIIKADRTISDFRNSINHPTTFDSSTTIKSDFKTNQHTMGKNGRKMHFRYELDKTTMSSLITELENIKPRRSDILITENFEDILEDDNNLSALNYLDKLKQNNSFSYGNPILHPAFESIIPLIPVVINDLREGRISPKDASILSEAFGKYWWSITVLANVTNLDMLPLLKMKNEEDWNNIWQSFLPETTSNSNHFTTVKTTEAYPRQKDDNYLPYDYLTEYEDFYEYVLESKKEKKEKRKIT